MDRNTNLRDLKVDTSTAKKEAEESTQLNGEAKDSLRGTNSTVQYETDGLGKGAKKNLGGENTSS